MKQIDGSIYKLVNLEDFSIEDEENNHCVLFSFYLAKM